jgi:hypothetical protein
MRGTHEGRMALQASPSEFDGSTIDLELQETLQQFQIWTRITRIGRINTDFAWKNQPQSARSARVPIGRVSGRLANLELQETLEKRLTAAKKSVILKVA